MCVCLFVRVRSDGQYACMCARVYLHMCAMMANLSDLLVCSVCVCVCVFVCMRVCLRCESFSAAIHANDS